MPDDLDSLNEAAVRAVVAASKICEAVRRDLVDSDRADKSDRSPVTVADFASQAVVARLLKEWNLPLVAEESAAEFQKADPSLREKVAAAMESSVDEAEQLIGLGGGDAAGGRYWVLDPIDGTKGFLRGGQYAVALALVEDGKVKFGVLGCPQWDAGRLFGSGSGVEGSTHPWTAPIEAPQQRQPISVAGNRSPIKLVESVESGHSDHDASSVIAATMKAGEPLRMDSQAKYAAVASGAADAYLRLPTRPGYEEKVWDHAAGLAVVLAAGGKVTDLDGKPLDFTRGRTLADNRGVVATSGYGDLHDRLLAAAGEALGG